MPQYPAETLDPDQDGAESETELCGEHDSRAPEAEEVLGEAGCNGECKGNADQNLKGADVRAVLTTSLTRCQRALYAKSCSELEIANTSARAEFTSLPLNTPA